MYILVFVILLLISFKVLNYLNIFPSYRFAQIYWHLTNNDVIENKYIKLKVPTKWIIAQETSSQYFLHGDYIEPEILKTIIIQKTVPDKKIFLDLNNSCEPNQEIYEKYRINKKSFELYGCKKLKKGGSLAYVFDDRFRFNMIVYDYSTSDTDAILEILNLVYIK